MNINEYENFKDKTIAEFIVAINKADKMISICIKNKNIKGALKALKYKIKLENLLSKKKKDGEKFGYDTHKRK